MCFLIQSLIIGYWPAKVTKALNDFLFLCQGYEQKAA